MKVYIMKALFIGSSLILLPVLMLYINDIPILDGMNEKSNQIELMAATPFDDMMDEEVLIGIVGKEIPYTYEMEAIKAQAVIERTYMARRILGIQNKGAIIGYTEEEMKKIWGEDYDSIYKIYKQAVEETKGQFILYENKPIEAVYHKASSGRTRDAKNVYNIDVAYLKGVDSSEDKISSHSTFQKQEIIEKIKKQYPNLAADAEKLENQMQIVEKDDAGYVNTIQVGNITMTGSEFTNLLNLPSAAFKIYNSGNKLIFDVRGIGNGVGMSQNGANEMAKQGKDYKEIILHYYTNVNISNYEFQK